MSLICVGRNGARVFFRNTADGMQIVAKADKSNESKVIGRLMEKYGSDDVRVW